MISLKEILENVMLTLLHHIQQCLFNDKNKSIKIMLRLRLRLKLKMKSQKNLRKEFKKKAI